MKMKYKFSEEQYKEIKIARKQNRDSLPLKGGALRVG